MVTRARYVMLTLETDTTDVEFRRVDYDVAAPAHTYGVRGLAHDSAIQIGKLETGGMPHLPA